MKCFYSQLNLVIITVNHSVTTRYDDMWDSQETEALFRVKGQNSGLKSSQ